MPPNKSLQATRDNVSSSASRFMAFPPACLSLDVRHYMPSLFLQVLGNDLDPERVSKAMGLRPSQSWRRGDRKGFVSRDGKNHWFRSKHKWGGWKVFFQSPKTESALIQKMTAVAKRLSKRKAKLCALAEDGHMIYLISLVQDVSSIVIPPSLHKRLGELHIHLQIDFWPQDDK